MAASATKALTYTEQGKLDTSPLKLEDIEETCRICENRLDGAIKIAMTVEE